MQQVVYEAHALAASSGKALQLSMTTNATRIDRGRAAFLRDAGFYLGISIDGGAAAHDATRPKRGGQSSFSQVMAGLTACLYEGVSFETISVVDPANVEYLGESVRWLAGLGVERISLNPNFAASWSERALLAWERGYEAAGDLFVERATLGRALHVNVLSDKMIAHVKGGLTDGDRCHAGRGSIAVAPSGNIYPCARMVGEDHGGRADGIVLGHTSTGIDRGRVAVFTALLEPAQDPEGADESCGSCSIKSRCMRACACANREETGEVGLTGGLVCWHEQLATRVADRAASQLFLQRNRTLLRVLYALPIAEGVA